MPVSLRPRSKKAVGLTMTAAVRLRAIAAPGDQLTNDAASTSSGGGSAEAPKAPAERAERTTDHTALVVATAADSDGSPGGHHDSHHDSSHSGSPSRASAKQVRACRDKWCSKRLSSNALCSTQCLEFGAELRRLQRRSRAFCGSCPNGERQT